MKINLSKQGNFQPYAAQAILKFVATGTKGFLNYVSSNNLSQIAQFVKG